MSRPHTTDLVPPWSLAVAAMVSVQLGSALSVPLVEEIGSAATAWLRLSMGALVFVAIQRPPLRSLRRTDVPAVVALGLATALMTLAFLAALARIPLGTAVAIEFLGPLTVAALRSPDRRALAWPALAFAGVVLMTEPWQGEVDLVGVGFAASAAVGLGAYIVLTQHIGDRLTGIGSLSMTIPVAAVVAALVAVPSVGGEVTPGVLLRAFGIALMLPVFPFILELLALRRMTPTAFGTLMAVEPAAGLLLGALVLAQVPTVGQLLGICLVVLAGAASQRGGRRPGEKPSLTDLQPA